MVTKHPAEQRSTVQMVEITESSVGQRLDNFLMKCLKNVPKSKVYNIIRKGEVRVNKGRSKPQTKLQLGDIVRIPPVSLKAAEPHSSPAVPSSLGELLSQSVIYEDDTVLVINKPSGLAVHGGSGIQLGLIESLRKLRPDAHYLELVHRLDRDTSGCIMVAKKRSMLRHLHEQLQRKRLTKVYQALVYGRWPNRRQRVDAPLLKNHLQSGERVVKVSEEGKRSITEFSILQRFQGATLVEARPITGRTHQIRVHAQFVGCPLVGDEKYASQENLQRFRDFGVKRLFLHASRLSFYPLDSEDRISVEAPLPDELNQLLNQLEQ